MSFPRMEGVLRSAQAEQDGWTAFCRFMRPSYLPVLLYNVLHYRIATGIYGVVVQTEQDVCVYSHRTTTTTYQSQYPTRLSIIR